MRRLATKKLLPILCSIVVLFVAVGAVMVSGAAFPWREEKNSVEKILERDGYIEGIWYPWLTHTYLGNGLTSNDLMTQYGVGKDKVGIDQYGEIKLYREIYNLKALGFNILGYEGSPYGEGVIYDDNGDILGVKDEYLNNMRRLLDICKEVGMPVLWSVCFHSSTLPGYYTDGKYAWDIISQAYVNPEIADHYAERFVEPVCDVLAEYPETVIMVASTVELENEMNDSEIGNNLSSDGRYMYGGNQEPMLYFMNAINETVKKKLPDVTRTLAANTKDMTIYRNIDFDALGLNHYTISANAPRLDDLKSPLPTICTEFGLGDGIKVDDDVWTIKQVDFRNSFRSNGYTGWVMWDWEPTNFSGSAYSLLNEGGKTTTDFRAGTYSLHYYILNYRRQHRNEEVELDKPILFCNTGSGTVEWIEPQQVPETYDILRSLDGGKTWETIAKNLKGQDEEFDTFEDLNGDGETTGKEIVPGYVQNFKGTYIDEEVANHAPDGTTVMYKVLARDADGLTATSDPNNEAEILGPPINLMEGYNYSFEEGFKGWKHNSSLEQLAGTEVTTSDYMVKLVNTLTFPGEEGEADVVVKPSHGNTMMEFKSLKRDSWAGFHISGIQLKPNTAYEIKVDARIAYDAEFDPTAEGAGRMGTYLNIRGAGPNGENWDDIPGASNYDGGPEDGTFTDPAGFFLLECSKTSWKTYTISFKTNDAKEGEETFKMGLDWRVYASEAGTPHYYIDNIRITEVR